MGIRLSYRVAIILLIAIGNVLSGLNTRPITGKYTGADCSITVIAASMPPRQI
ncbi:MAG: hypothetical protein GX271_11865 [Clostridiales bacterium]|nr:hypothetical protein [Clostridiales bacterium]